MACSLLDGLIAMPRRPPAPHAAAPVLERSGEVSLVSGEISLEDFAFADTVMVPDLPLDVMPASHRNPELPYEMYAEPPPPVSLRRAQAKADLGAHLRLAWARMEDGVKSSREEMNLLWDATAETDARAPVGRRLRTFFSFFEWQRDDVLRAAWIGFAMLVVLATLAAVALTR